MNIQERIELSELFEEYGSLLTDKQHDMIELYCCMDLSLNEISEQTGISRQGVRDHISHGKVALENYEDKLGIVRFKRRLMRAAYSEYGNDKAIEEIRKILEE